MCILHRSCCSYVSSTQMDCMFFIFGQNQSLHPWTRFSASENAYDFSKNIAENSQQFHWSISKLNTANLANYCNKVITQCRLFITTYQQSIKSWFKISTMHINHTEVTNIKSEHIFFFVLFLKNMGAVSCIKLPNEKRAGNEGHGCAVGELLLYM